MPRSSPRIARSRASSRRASSALPSLRTIAALLLVHTSPTWTQTTAPSVDAASSPQRLDRVVVTGNPVEHADLFDLVSPVTVLSGTGLALRRQATLGETLAAVPGVATSYFGPNASRPVIRGLDSDRIRILQNGIGTIDASALSNDHATAIDPLFIKSIEVVRGPAALLYGGSAIGGVVNVIDGRIPQERVDGVAGGLEVKGRGAEHLKSGAAYADIGTSSGSNAFVLHLDAYDRRSQDVEIPGFARSDRQRAIDDRSLDQPRGRLPDSAAHAYGGALGGSYIAPTGYLGLSLASTRSTYGTVAEDGSTIRMKQERGDVAGEARELGFLDKVKFKAGYTDYEHTEFDDGAPVTTFENKGYEVRIDAIHRRLPTALGTLEGAFGVQVARSTFSALGEEAFVPETTTRNAALFAFEEWHLDPIVFNGGVRVEQTRLVAKGGGPIDPPTGLDRFGTGSTRNFNAVSASAGAIYKLTPGLSFVFTGTSTQRAPTYFELFANGVHAATAGYEIGDPTLAKETSRSFEASLRAREGRVSGTLTAYRTRFSNYVGVFATGNTRDAQGNLNPVPGAVDPSVTAAGDDILTEYRYAAVPAVFTGFEVEGKARLVDGAQTLDVEASADRVRADDRRNGQPLPRIAPLKVRAALVYGVGPFGAQIEVIHAKRQARVPDGQLPTDSYTLTNAFITWRFDVLASEVTAYLRATNLFDQDARVASSFLRDIAPLPGRSIQGGLRASF